MKKVNTILIFLFLFTVFSCAKNEENNLSADIVGEWLRSDFKDDFEYRLFFESDNSGYKTVRSGTMETTVTSSLVTFDWNVDDNMLVISENDDVIKTSILINKKDQLELKEYSELHFNRVIE